MKAKVVERVARFIECENCGYERSFLLEGDVEYQKFDWNCPSCDEHWGGLFQHDGSILIGRLSDREIRFIVVEMPEPWSPFVMTATRDAPPREAAKRVGSQSRSVKRSFYLAPCAPDPENNPHGFAQYKARDF